MLWRLAVCNIEHDAVDLVGNQLAKGGVVPKCAEHKSRAVHIDDDGQAATLGLGRQVEVDPERASSLPALICRGCSCEVKRCSRFGRSCLCRCLQLDDERRHCAHEPCTEDLEQVHHSVHQCRHCRWGCCGDGKGVKSGANVESHASLGHLAYGREVEEGH